MGEFATMAADDLVLVGTLTVAASPPNPLTQLLAAVGQGDVPAQNRLWALIYDELHSVAQGQLAAERGDRTLQPTTLVHEAYLRLTADEDVQWVNRRHFFAAAAQAMRRIRIDDARKRNRQKRGGGRQPGRLVSEPPVFDQDPAEVLAVDEAVNKLEQIDPRKAEVVLLRYFTGLTVAETAEVLGVSPRTVDNEWRFARAWLRRELARGDTAAGWEE
ncbi:MAG: sigma-70 family RNA polymerase sigma factor [Phycisphaerales bacterium]|nr:MAG: sigma-70 family RNA polymerase sigma factor [Phycisphaerales bacterium]